MSPYDEMVAERFNSLAVKVAKLEQENAALRANQLPAGAVCFVPTGEVRFPKEGEYFDAGDVLAVANFNFSTHEYPIYRRVEAQGAEPVRCMNESSEGMVYALRQEVERLKGDVALEKECYAKLHLAHCNLSHETTAKLSDLRYQVAANQEAADVLRLIEAGRLSIEPVGRTTWQIMGEQCIGVLTIGLRNCWQTFIRTNQKHLGITLPAKDEQPNHQALYDGMKDTQQWVEKQTSPSPDVASGAEGEKRTGLIFECVNGPAVVEPIPNDSDSLQARYRVVRGYVVCGDFYTKTDADVWCSFINGTSPVHQQLAEARAEIESLRRCRDAWDAVRKHLMYIERKKFFGDTDWKWAACTADKVGWISGHTRLDPIEAVLELAKTLEKGG